MHVGQDKLQRYFGPDIAYFVQHSPYFALARPGSAVRFVKQQAEAGEECCLALHAYPFLHIEPLEFFYTCLRNLGALDQALLEALCGLTWRGVVWGAWLAMLEPRSEFVGPLRAARPNPYNDWLVDCAISVIEQRAPPPQHEVFVELAARCRRCLDGVPRPVVLLRLEPTASEIARIERERDHVRSVYAEAGTNAALRCIPGTLAGNYALDYVRWVRSARRGTVLHGISSDFPS